MNRPLFRSEGTSVGCESNNNPTVFSNNRVLLNGQGIYSVQPIASNVCPMPQSANNVSQMNTNANGNGVIAIPFPIPGGLTFTFQQSCPCPRVNNVQTTQCIHQPQQLQQQCQQQSLPYYTNNNGQQLSQIDYCGLLRQLEQHIMEKMMAQSQQQCKPFQLRFHCNAGTSTSCLLRQSLENYKTTQTETQVVNQQLSDCGCGCDCKPQICIQIETSSSNSSTGAEHQCEGAETTTNARGFQDYLNKCIEDIKSNSKDTNELPLNVPTSNYLS